MEKHISSELSGYVVYQSESLLETDGTLSFGNGKGTIYKMWAGYRENTELVEYLRKWSQQCITTEGTKEESNSWNLGSNMDCMAEIVIFH